MTDEGWQHDFTGKASGYADGVLYHSKAGFFKIGNDERYMPFSVEMGLEMAAVYGGKAYLRQPDGTFVVSDGKGGLKGMWDAFFPGGADTGRAGKFPVDIVVADFRIFGKDPQRRGRAAPGCQGAHIPRRVPTGRAARHQKDTVRQSAP